MYRIWGGLAVFVGFIGCATDQHLEPPKPPEEYNLPPERDLRYSKPIEYPADSMPTDIFSQAKQKGKNGNNGPTMNGMPGGGGGGGMGGGGSSMGMSGPGMGGGR